MNATDHFLNAAPPAEWDRMMGRQIPVGEVTNLRRLSVYKVRLLADPSLSPAKRQELAALALDHIQSYREKVHKTAGELEQVVRTDAGIPQEWRNLQGSEIPIDQVTSANRLGEYRKKLLADPSITDRERQTLYRQAMNNLILADRQGDADLIQQLADRLNRPPEPPKPAVETKIDKDVQELLRLDAEAREFLKSI